MNVISLRSMPRPRMIEGAPTFDALKSRPSTKRMRTQRPSVSAWKRLSFRSCSSAPTSTSRIGPSEVDFQVFDHAIKFPLPLVRSAKFAILFELLVRYQALGRCVEEAPKEIGGSICKLLIIQDDFRFHSVCSLDFRDFFFPPLTSLSLFEQRRRRRASACKAASRSTLNGERH